jgi:hypothetical protein
MPKEWLKLGKDGQRPRGILASAPTMCRAKSERYAPRAALADIDIVKLEATALRNQAMLKSQWRSAFPTIVEVDHH